ncbi:reverse transcriptase [Vairimorpha necatrix]|uniref:Reverse transcriptase n=1 Tax=Vairimorpha necatrix TaxID=6039 RepID=A0AAX4JEX1_9MICR
MGPNEIKKQETLEYRKPENVRDKETISQVVNIKFKIRNIKQDFNEEVYIVEPLPEDIILGARFIINNDMILDFKNKAIILNNQITSVANNQELEPIEMESILYSRLCCIREIDQLEETTLKNNITRYIKENGIIKETINKCEKCIRCKNNKKSDKTKSNIQARSSFQILCTDIFGPFELTDYVHNEIQNKGFFLTVE